MLKTSFLLLAAFLLMVACPGPRTEDYSQASPPKTPTTTSNPQAAPENSTTMNPVVPPQTERPTTRVGGAALQTVEVQLSEYSIRMPETLAAGKYNFKVVNSGKETHNFAIEGGSLHTTFPDPLMRGDIRELGVDLAPGKYMVYCPVDGHHDKGMMTNLTVK